MGVITDVVCQPIVLNVSMHNTKTTSLEGKSVALNRKAFNVDEEL